MTSPRPREQRRRFRDRPRAVDLARHLAPEPGRDVARHAEEGGQVDVAAPSAALQRMDQVLGAGVAAGHGRERAAAVHALSLKFHLERRTGGLSRIISRGTAGVDTVLRFSLFNTFPTALEIALVAGALTWSFGWIYAAVILGTVVFYLWFTYAATEWRINIRRDMNEADTDANTKAIDSLLEFRDRKVFRQRGTRSRPL